MSERQRDGGSRLANTLRVTIPAYAQKIGSFLMGRVSAGHGAQIALTNVIILVLSFSTGLLSARILGAEGRGILLALTLWPQVFGYCASLGLPSALISEVRRKQFEAPTLIWTALGLSAAAGTVSGAIGYLLIPGFLTGYDQEFVRAAQIFLVLAPVSLIGVTILAVFQIEGNFARLNASQLAIPLLTLFLLLVLYIADLFTPLSAAAAFLAPPLLVTTVNLFWIQRRFPLTFNVVHGPAVALLRYGLRAYPMDLVVTLSPWLDRIILVSLLTPHQMGLYAVARSIVQPLMTLPAAATMVLFPRIVNNEISEIRRLTGLVCRVSTATTFLLASGFVMVGSVLLPVLYGADFSAALGVFRILAVESVVAGVAWILTQAFMAAGRPGIVSATQVGGMALSCALTLLAAMSGNLEIIAYAILAATLFRVLCIYLIFSPVLKITPPGLILTYQDIAKVTAPLRRASLRADP